MRPAFLFLLTLPLACGGCGARLAHYAGYHGDGSFSVQPAPSALCGDGYTLDLGPIDLAATGEVTRTLDGLPPVDAVIGLALYAGAAAQDPLAAHRPAANIELTLRDERGHIVLSRQEPLTQWIARRLEGDSRHAFLLQRGTQAEIPVAPGVARVERFPLGRDDSWGTYFSPRRGARYTLHFAVETPDAAAGAIAARLQVQAAAAGCP